MTNDTQEKVVVCFKTLSRHLARTEDNNQEQIQ
jgi:hypothetical protein